MRKHYCWLEAELAPRFSSQTRLSCSTLMARPANHTSQLPPKNLLYRSRTNRLCQGLENAAFIITMSCFCIQTTSTHLTYPRQSDIDLSSHAFWAHHFVNSLNTQLPRLFNNKKEHACSRRRYTNKNA